MTGHFCNEKDRNGAAEGNAMEPKSVYIEAAAGGELEHMMIRAGKGLCRSILDLNNRR